MIDHLACLFKKLRKINRLEWKNFLSFVIIKTNERIY